MKTFQFTVDGEVLKFTANMSNKSIRNSLESSYPNCTLELRYCLCMDACQCEEGHFVSTSKWCCDDISKPWLGRNVEYSVPLQIVTNDGSASNYTDSANGNRF